MRKRIRVLYVLETGADVRFIEAFRDDYELLVLTHRGLKDRWVTWPSRRTHEVEAVVLPCRRQLFPLNAFTHLVRLRDAYDVVLVLDNGPAALFAAFARGLTGRPLVVQVGRAPDEYYRCLYWRGLISWNRFIVGYLARKLIMTGVALGADCSAVVCQSLRQRSWYNRRKTCLVPWYGVDTHRFVPATTERRMQLREELGLPKDRSVVLYPCRVAPEKDPETLLEAVRMISSKRCAPLVLNLGGGYTQFEALAQQIGVSAMGRPAVHPVTELPAYYQQSDLVVYSSLAEGLGLAHLEALACEVPLVVTAVGGLTDLVVNHVHGLVVPPRSPQAMAEAIDYALSHPEGMREMSRRGRTAVIERYSQQHAFDSLRSIIEALAT